ncbi:hypothetical protein EJB05_06000, partial [Eragrostis curvula]
MVDFTGSNYEYTYRLVPDEGCARALPTASLFCKWYSCSSCIISIGLYPRREHQREPKRRLKHIMDDRFDCQVEQREIEGAS